MRNELLYEWLLRLPFSFTERAWQRALLPACASGVRPSTRLGYLICQAHAALAQSSSARADFWVMCAEPTNEVEFPDEVHLVAKLVSDSNVGDFIEILLQEEEAESTHAAWPY